MNIKGYSIELFCRLMGISRSTWYAMVAQNRAPAFMKVGRRVIIPESAISEWQNNHLKGTT